MYFETLPSVLVEAVFGDVVPFCVVNTIGTVIGCVEGISVGANEPTKKKKNNFIIINFCWCFLSMGYMHKWAIIKGRLLSVEYNISRLFLFYQT